MRKLLLFTVVLFTCLSCNSRSEENAKSSNPGSNVDMEFDKIKWRMKEDNEYIYRNQMLEDIVYNDTIRSLTKNQVLELLGEPDRSTKGYLYYNINRRSLGAWTVHTTTMVIKVPEDSTIEWIKIHK